jgi:endonuclease YncB( thermonuclease family)
MRIFSKCLLSLFLLPGAAVAQDFSGVVFRIMDGDSLWVRTPQEREIEVRLADIDAPERNQPYADAARDALNELVFGKTVEVRFNDTDNYGRIVARLYADKVDVSAEMLRRGLAWVYRDYVRDQSLFGIETAARAGRRGLWGSAEAAVPPWEWRRNARSTPAARREVPAEFTCGTKRYCREMASCEEARFYLTQCGVTTMDGDNDGIPCEDRCR